MKNLLREWLSCLGETPLGPLRLSFTDRGLAALTFAGEGLLPHPAQESPPNRLQGLMEAAKRQLTDYFAGIPTDFASLPLAPLGTAFQLRVWQELRRIPYGTAISYGELARRLGNPKACRAVGQANAVNPIPLIIPCHRVINADGALGGYSSGPDYKRWLLDHEGGPQPAR